VRLRSWEGVAGAVVVFLILGMRLVAVFIDVDPGAPTDQPLVGPSFAHLLGTDQLGRDVLERMIESTEAFVVPGVVAVCAALGVGVPLGAGIGFWPRTRSAAVARFGLTIVGAWPRLVLVVVVVAIFMVSVSDPAAWASARLYVLALLVALSFVPQLAHEIAEKVLTFQREEFVEAARAHGIPDSRILFHHILWANCRELVLRQCCLLFASFLLVETSLSYLGDYGVPPPRPSWGNILSDVRSQVIHVRSLARPESLSPGDVLDGLLRAVQEGAALAVLAPTVAIVASIAGLLALARHFAESRA
jgi:peptide/nickel transport system permease protein